MNEEAKITVIRPKRGVKLPEFKGLKVSPVVIVIATIVLAIVSVISAILLYQRRLEPVAPTAPKPAAAVGESCTLAFTILGPTPSPSPTPSGTPGPTPTPTPTPSPTPTPTPTPSGTPGPTPTPTPDGTPKPTPTPVAIGPTPTPVTLEEAGSVAGTWTISIAGILLLGLGSLLLLAF